MKLRTSGVILLLAAALSTPALASPPFVALADTNGIVHRLPAGQGKAQVLIFIGDDCPISNSYAPEIKRLFLRCAARGIPFYLINEDAGVSSATVKRHSRQYDLQAPTFLDPKHRLAKLTGATVTPEAVVFRTDGSQLYRGRLDNRYLDFGKMRPAATIHDLRAVLEAIISGNPIKFQETKAVGCFI